MSQRGGEDLIGIEEGNCVANVSGDRKAGAASR